MDILIYSGEGVSGHLLRHVARFLNRFLSNGPSKLEIKRVDADYLIRNPDWETRTFLLVFPGGRDVPYDRALSGVGTRRILSFVREGGLYLGICAGAYFGCRSIYFDIPDSIIQEPRQLSFFPGEAFGPVYGREEFSYSGYAGVKAVPLVSEYPLGLFMYYGGCSFRIEDGEGQRVTTEAVYADLDHQPPAIVMMEVGKGKVLLSGVHLEYDSSSCRFPDPHLEEISRVLGKEENRIQSELFLQDLMARFTD